MSLSSTIEVSDEEWRSFYLGIKNITTASIANSLLLNNAMGVKQVLKIFFIEEALNCNTSKHILRDLQYCAIQEPITVVLNARRKIGKITNLSVEEDMNAKKFPTRVLET